MLATSVTAARFSTGLAVATDAKRADETNEKNFILNTRIFTMNSKIKNKTLETTGSARVRQTKLLRSPHHKTAAHQAYIFNHAPPRLLRLLSME